MHRGGNPRSWWRTENRSGFLGWCLTEIFAKTGHQILASRDRESCGKPAPHGCPSPKSPYHILSENRPRERMFSVCPNVDTMGEVEIWLTRHACLGFRWTPGWMLLVPTHRPRPNRDEFRPTPPMFRHRRNLRSGTGSNTEESTRFGERAPLPTPPTGKGITK